MNTITKIYIVYDSEGYKLKSFKSWTLADHYRNLMGRPDWEIKSYYTNKFVR